MIVNPANPLAAPHLPQPRLHPFFRLLIAVVGCVLVQLVVVLLLAIFFYVSAAATGVNFVPGFNNFLNQNLLLATAFTYPPLLVVLWLCRRYLDCRSFTTLGLRERGFLSQFLWGLLGGFLACAFAFGILLITRQVSVTGLSTATSTGGARVFANLAGHFLLMLCVGFFEEVSFRGYALHNLNRWLGTRPAVTVQAVVFALIHLSNVFSGGPATPDSALAAWLAMPNIALIGIFFALCYLKTGSLWFPIAFHASWNFALGCIFSLPVSGLPLFRLLDVEIGANTFLTGGSFGLEASVLLTPILLALCLIVARAEDSPQARVDLQSLTAGTNEPAEEEIPAPDPLEEFRENRFKTRMSPQIKELDAETMATLRALNEETKQREEAKRLDTQTAPFADLPSAIAAETTPQEPAAMVHPEEATVSETPTVEAPKPPALQPVSEIPMPPAMQAPPVTPPPTIPRPDTPTEPPKKARPKW